MAGRERSQVEDCYLRMYLQHWREDEWSGALAVIPHDCDEEMSSIPLECVVTVYMHKLGMMYLHLQVFSWDDHEIFDAWGCYAPDLQNSAVFQLCKSNMPNLTWQSPTHALLTRRASSNLLSSSSHSLLTMHHMQCWPDKDRMIKYKD
eukprot:1015898-Pelagomonas_calceolata.AAC.3